MGSTPETTISSYISAFALEAAAMFFQLPLTVLHKAAEHILTSRYECQIYLDEMISAAREQGYAASTCEYIHAVPLNDSTALCSALSARRRADGSEVGRVAGTYLLRKEDDHWWIRQIWATDFDKLL
jgi:hypothetical protein